MARIFISYRRDDTAGYAGWLFTLLRDHFERDDIFMDIDSLDVGEDFVSVLEREIGSCDAVVALIGPTWLSATDAAGHRRLDDPRDFVRLELAAALARGVRVCPALVHGAIMPNADELPDDLKPLVRRNAIELSATRFADDVRRLVSALERALAEPGAPATSARPAVAPAVSERVVPSRTQVPPSVSTGRDPAREPAGIGPSSGTGEGPRLSLGLGQRWTGWSRARRATVIVGTIIALYLVVFLIHAAVGGGSTHRSTAQSPGTPAGSQRGGPSTQPASRRAPHLAHPVYLDTLPATLGADTSSDQVIPGQVTVGGHSYRHGVQFIVGLVQDTADASYSIPRGARSFSAVIGNDDNQTNELWTGISVLYEVFVDGRRAATGHAQGHTHDPPLKVPVANGATIELKVTNANGGGGGTSADWADPVFR